jgi:hyaluronan synthase
MERERSQDHRGQQVKPGQQAGLDALIALAQRAADPDAQVDLSQQKAASAKLGKKHAGHHRADRLDSRRLRRHHWPVLRGGKALAAGPAIRGALNHHYDIPEVEFHRKPVRGLILSVLLIGGIAWWRAYNHVSWVLLVCLFPVLVTRLLSWSVSWLDKPYTATPEQQAELDRLTVAVAIPCWNEDPPLLDRCLYALANQTRVPQLVWVVDDGSTKVNYETVRGYWERKWPNGMEVRWTYQENAGKRKAHTVPFRHAGTDVIVTVDSDTTLAANALEEGLKPFTNPEIMSVAGIEHGYNSAANFLTRLQCCLQLFAQVVTGATWSVFGDMYTNRGPFALYRQELIAAILDQYANETFFGKQVILGDDSLLALAGSTYGKSVQQLTAFGLTMWPEDLSHHLRQRIRWARGRTMRNFWRAHYRPWNSFCLWYTLGGIYTFLFSTCLLILLVVDWPGDERIVGHAILGLVALTFLASPRVLCIRKSDETWGDRLAMILIRPIADLWASIVLSRLVRAYGTVTVMHQDWTTRRKGPELVLEPSELVLDPTEGMYVRETA